MRPLELEPPDDEMKEKEEETQISCREATPRQRRFEMVRNTQLAEMPSSSSCHSRKGVGCASLPPKRIRFIF